MKGRKWVKCKWTPPPTPVTIALVLQELFEVLILRLWFHSVRKGTLGVARPFMIPLCPAEMVRKYLGSSPQGLIRCCCNCCPVLFTKSIDVVSQKSKMLIFTAGVPFLFVAQYTQIYFISYLCKPIFYYFPNSFNLEQIKISCHRHKTEFFRNIVFKHLKYYT